MGIELVKVKVRIRGDDPSDDKDKPLLVEIDMPGQVLGECDQIATTENSLD